MKKQKKKSVWRLPILVLWLAAIFACFAGGFWKLKEYADSARVYENARSYVNQQAIPEEFVLVSDESSSGEVGDSSEPGLLVPKIDWAALKAINPDLVGYLHIPALALMYPLVQGEDDDYYLNYSFDKVRNSSGCIFLQHNASSDMSDSHTFIYGHNMINGSMFGSLKRFSKEPSLVLGNPYFYIYGENEAFMYEIFAYHVTPTGGYVYQGYSGKEGYIDYVKHCINDSEYPYSERNPRTPYDFTEYPPLVTLNTCTGYGHKQMRVVHGFLVNRYERVSK